VSKKIRKIYQMIQEKLGLKKSTESMQSPSKQNYFTQARSWADDLYTAAIISRNRYQMAFFAAMGLVALSILALIALIPLQHSELLLVNHYPDGRVWVEPTHQPYAPSNPSQVESELIHYVVNRESFAESSYKEQYSLINLMSNNEVAQQYRDAQSSNNPDSPIIALKRDGLRSVHVESVIFLDSVLKNKGKPPSEQSHTNLAEVNFTVSDQSKNSTLIKTHALTVLISWTYRGTPKDPGDRWRNWNGFTVTRYSVEQRNL
jgi:type IV secretion system protein VirB8